MNIVLKRSLALMLSASLLLTSAAASVALGSDLHKSSETIGENASLNKEIFWSATYSDLREENYIEFMPSDSLEAVVSYGNTILSTSSVATMAQSLEAEGYRVLGGTNGDYYVVATGNPLGIVLTDGVLRSSASYLNAVGFMEDGSAIIGQPDLTVTAHFPDYSLKIADVNKVRTETGGYYLLTEDFSSTTQNTSAGIDVILSPNLDLVGTTVSLTGDSSDSSDNLEEVPEDAEEFLVTDEDIEELISTSGDDSILITENLQIGTRVSCTVEAVLESTGSIEIPEGKFVITINNNSGDFLVNYLSSLEVGDVVDIDVTTSDERWESVVSAVGALYRILDNGVVQSDLDNTTAPRTAVGIKADGTVIFYTIDGRQSGLSIGATMTQVAERLLELGCVDAVCLDGGGSTTFGATGATDDSFSIINSPSDGSIRSVTNGIFLCSTLSPTGDAAYLNIDTENSLILAGQSTNLSAYEIDSAYYPIGATSNVTWDATGGSVSDDGIYTAPETAMTDTIYGEKDGISGSTTVTVVANPTAMSLQNESTGVSLSSLQVEESSVTQLSPIVSYQTLALEVPDESFTYTLSSDSLGSIDESGTFTASNYAASGTLTVSIGDYSQSYAVSVSSDSHYRTLASFEDRVLSDFIPMTGTELSLNTIASQVKYGDKSLAIYYNLENGQGELYSSFSLESKEKYLSMWVYGDSSGNALNLTYTNTSGSSDSTSLCTLNFTGWQEVNVTLPTDIGAITGFSITGSTDEGTIYLDQIVVSNKSSLSTSAPSISNFTISGTSLSATISDDNSYGITDSQIAVSYDGKALVFSYNSSTGALTATLPSMSDTLHRVSIVVSDASGNLARSSQDVDMRSSTSSQFVDMADHWASYYTDPLAEAGIITGIESNGSYYFSPNSAITRGDFALMTARWMGLYLDYYKDVSLPFADANEIPDWSYTAVQAMYALGVMQGSEVDGVYYANPTDPITRAEAMTILGRIQEKGYALGDLTIFTDYSSIPSWASDYVSTLVEQGVVSGYEGLVRPWDSVSRGEVAKLLFSLW